MDVLEQAELVTLLNRLTPRDIPAAIGALEAAKVELQSRLFTSLIPESRPGPVAILDRRLRAEAVAELLGRSSGWVYRHAREIPGLEQPSGHRGRIWWRERAVRGWMAKGCPRAAA